MKKTALITGATSGFGKACARALAQEHHPVILTGRRADRLEELKHELCEYTSVTTLVQDIRDPDSVAETLSNIPEAFRNVDVLINNAGLALGLEPSQKTNLEDWDTMIETNCKGLVHMTRAILPQMVERRTGHIINIGSIAGNSPYPGGNVYGATKAFVKQFSLNLRCDLLGTNVKVSNLEPGMAETEFSLVRYKGDEERAKKIYSGTQALRAEDIADIVVWLVSTPPHVNVNTLEVMPTQQAWGPFTIHRDTE